MVGSIIRISRFFFQTCLEGARRTSLKKKFKLLKEKLHVWKKEIFSIIDTTIEEDFKGLN